MGKAGLGGRGGKNRKKFSPLSPHSPHSVGGSPMSAGGWGDPTYLQENGKGIVQETGFLAKTPY
ncbi:MAG: hypothetical protein F6J93_22620 [Oscillatoria sp. SIO1A7]|nr:hypothetical protein [Oscillatoria sp. SIO1A7]